MRWGACFVFLCSVLFPRVALAQDEPPMYVFPFSRVPVHYPKDHLHYLAVDVEGCYARILAPTAGFISQLPRLDKWTPENDSPGTRGGLTITVQGDDGIR